MARSNARCYRLLGLLGGEGIEQIRGAYRDLARKHHPDRVGGDGERFKEITSAYNQLVQCVSDRAAFRVTPSNSPRGPRRRREDARQSGGQASKETPWSPESGKADSPRAEKADWSTFEQYYRENLKKRRQRNARAESVSASASASRPQKAVEKTPNSKTKQDAFAPHTAGKESAPSSRRPAVQPNGPIPERRQKTTTPTTPEMDSDFAAAWKAWCENARRFDARHGWRNVASDTPRSEKNDSDADIESDTNTGWRRWFRRGIKKITKRQNARFRGRDINLRLPVSVGVLMDGGQQRIAVRRLVQCPSCAGQATETCLCEGSGRVEVRDEIQVAIPVGTRYGAKIKVAGKGSEGLGDFADGDLLLELEPNEIPGFRREGSDIHGSCLITADVARSGGFVTVGLPRGGVRVKVPARTCVGDRFRLRGQGLPMGPDERVGDAYLTVRVD
jgi:DnaJ-class molecular chaperone